MRSLREAEKRMRDGEDCLKAAEELFLRELYRSSMQNSQGCVELCAKAVISLFEEPDWTHNPGRQLKEILKIHEEAIGENEVEKLSELAQDAGELAPWHGKVLYGEATEEGLLPAVELCTKESAEWALNKAKRAFHSATAFLTKWKEK